MVTGDGGGLVGDIMVIGEGGLATTDGVGLAVSSPNT